MLDVVYLLFPTVLFYLLLSITGLSRDMNSDARLKLVWAFNSGGSTRLNLKPVSQRYHLNNVGPPKN